MRNSEARRYARWSATVAILLAMVVGGVYLRRGWLVKQDEKKGPPSVPSSIQERSADFSYSKVDGQRTLFTIRASRATEFKAGTRSLLEDVTIQIYGRSGERNDTLSTRSCDFIASSGRITCAGDVRISLQSSNTASAQAAAIEVMTSNLSFERDTGKAQTVNPVTFRWPGGEGRSVGTTYDSNKGTLSLDRAVEVSLASRSKAVAQPAGQIAQQHAGPQVQPQRGTPSGPQHDTSDAQHQTLQLTGNTMVFHRNERTVQMLGSVRAIQESSQLTAENVLLALDTDLYPRSMMASGRPQLSDTSADEAMSIVAEEISGELNPQGWLKLVTATGSVKADRKTSAGSDHIDAGRILLNFAGQANMPRLLSASGAVVLTSQGIAPGAGARRIESNALEAHFTDDHKGKSLLQSVNTLAPTVVELQNVALSGGKSVAQKLLMRGRQMALQFNGDNQLQQLTSAGDVDVTRQIANMPEQTTTSGSLIAKFATGGLSGGVTGGIAGTDWSTIDQTGGVKFNDGLRTGQSDAAHLDRATRTVTLNGHVALADPTFRTTAQSATFSEGSSEFRAEGNVQTTELRAGAGSVANLAAEPAHVSAQRMQANTALGHAVYSGGSRLWQGGSVIESDSIDLDSPSHVLIARGHVRGVFPQSATASINKPVAAHSQDDLWHVRGGTLTYWGSDAHARIAQGATAQSSQGSIQARVIDMYFSTGGSMARQASPAKDLARVVAAGDVEIAQGARKGSSERAEYTGSEGKFVLSGGKPTLYDSTGNTTTGAQLTFFLADDRIVVDSGEGSRTVTLHRVEK